MAAIQGTDSRLVVDDLTIRAPRQKRTREQWERVLDAGVQLLEEGGYEAFTIAALCERAVVAPRALYARTATKDGLFLAVYERGMERVLSDHLVFADPARWAVPDDETRVRLAVERLVGIFVHHEAFLRAVVLISNAHPEVLRRGAIYIDRIRQLFVRVLAPVNPRAGRADRARERDFLFSMVFSAMVVRTAYGEGFGPAGDTSALQDELVTMAWRYLLGEPAESA